MPVLTVKVTPKIARCDLDPDDQELEGSYDIELFDHVPEDRWGNAALDVFHDRVAVSVLEDFEFDVAHPSGVPVRFRDDVENYALKSAGRLA